jgi:hypothetical protein
MYLMAKNWLSRTRKASAWMWALLCLVLLTVFQVRTHHLDGVVCGRGRNPTLRLWPAIFSGEIDVFPSERRNMGQEIGR